MSIIETICLVIFSSGALLFGLGTLLMSLQSIRREVENNVTKTVQADIDTMTTKICHTAETTLSEVHKSNQAAIDAIMLRLNRLEERNY